ncbi:MULTISPECIES: phosphotransferase enzyme family protein [Thiorhodovibrio]|uniref:phosphotransferase enzyme family protein n=1 Tax=Thiorhodovibrio TaxID=61593 RepID=UPI001F5CEA3A|nr:MULTISPECIES: aminoglycoside phosphotransferase family protein [Thiorhodovibrio]
MAVQFPVCQQIQAVNPLGNGLINATFAVQARGGHFVLQRINSAVFPNPPLIMANLARLQHAAMESGLSAPRLPRLFQPGNGSLCARDRDGHYWRLMERIEHGVPLTRVENPAQAASIGRVLGVFHRFGADLAVTDFHITLPQSHDTLGYRSALDAALAAAPDFAPGGDAVAAGLDAIPGLDALIDQVRARDPVLGCLRDARDAGLIHNTLVHGDPKRDNVLFDAEGRQALCLIDLDTVQPGLILHDIGDCLRSCCNPAGESSRPGQVSFDAHLAAALLRGYAEAAPGLLRKSEIELLFDAVRLIPLELSIRFLVDHLRGDRYFRVRYRGENLEKAKAQLALVADIERQEKQLRDLGRCFDADASRP